MADGALTTLHGALSWRWMSAIEREPEMIEREREKKRLFTVVE